MATRSKPINLSVDNLLFEKIACFSKALGVPMTVVVRTAIKDFIHRLETSEDINLIQLLKRTELVSSYTTETAKMLEERNFVKTRKKLAETIKRNIKVLESTQLKEDGKHSYISCVEKI